ncbi:hypothetical protein [Pengzhenrongella frigida]|uniref:Uncharacterized protein n=1 Tax=Pengzhenrongella frigida TaxID=1259133 RepID=A0A4Q5MXU2_9MICO|nr:hypothetical protein [Cellulomonas sp. HLT2-17]RYV50498.1 hypothetical protein EUA98_13240 [Cellulomonas sp. HLT2-17]
MTTVPFDRPALDLSGWDSGPLSGALSTSTSAATPSPSPGRTGDLEPGDVSPGLIGFLPVFLIALACIGLFLSLTSKLRKVNRKQAQIDAEEAAAASAATTAPGVVRDDDASDGADR